MKIKIEWTKMTLAQKRIYVDFGAHDGGTDLGDIELWIGPRNWDKKRKDASGTVTTLEDATPLVAKLGSDGSLTLEPGFGYFAGPMPRTEKGRLERKRQIRRIVRKHSLRGIKDIDITLKGPAKVCKAFFLGDYEFFKQLAA